MSRKREIRLKDEKEFLEILEDIRVNSRFEETQQYTQHGVTSVFRHSIAVAYYSCYLAERWNIPVRKRELIRGALLHDYFLYDWHEKSDDHRLHGFTHPARALRNAANDFHLTHVEQDIIRKHMFPLTLLPPVYRESVIVCIADKICSTYETINRKKVDWLIYHLA